MSTNDDAQPQENAGTQADGTGATDELTAHDWPLTKEETDKRTAKVIADMEQRDRDSKVKAADDARKAEQTLAHRLGAIGLVVIGLSIVLPVIALPTGSSDPDRLFKALALSAAIEGAVAAFIRMRAHGRSTAWDGFGKQLGFSAAFVAATAAGALFMVDFATIG